MTPDTLAPETPAAARNGAKPSPPLRILVVSTSLEPGRSFPAPVDFANALCEQGASVLFAAAVGPLRKELSHAVSYLLIDDAESAPVKTAHELMRLIHHHRPDVVHAHGARCAMVCALAVRAGRSKCSRVMTYHSPGLIRIPRWIKGSVLRKVADRYFAADATLAAELESLGVAAERIRVEPIDDLNSPAFARRSLALYRELVHAAEPEA